MPPPIGLLARIRYNPFKKKCPPIIDGQRNTEQEASINTLVES